MYNVTVTTKIGGIETYYWEVSNVLNKLHHDVEIICGRGNLIQYDNIALKQFSYLKREKCLNLGNRFRKFVERVTFFWNAKQHLKSNEYDIFLIHKPLDFFTCFFIKKYHPNIKTIFISGGEDFYGYDKFFAKYVDHMFSVSHNNAQKIQARYNRHIPVIPNGVNLKYFIANRSDKESLVHNLNITSSKILISVGRIVGWKGFQLVIESLKNLPDFAYIIIGDGEYLETLKQLVHDNNLTKRVFFIGNIDNKQLSNYLNCADIFVQPSIGHEAFGITIIEAMACGLPVVASRNGGIVDIIEDNQTGYLFDINDKQGLIDKIHQAYDNKTAMSIISENHVKQHFTWESCVKNLLKHITNVDIERGI